MSLIPYSCQQIETEDIEAVCKALRGEFITQGPTVTAFEEAFAARHRVSHAVAVANATAGLHIGCLALGVGAGSRVWTSPNSFVASANCALYCGADVDFVDIDPISRNMSVIALERKLAVSKKRRALPDVVIPVHFSGLPCDLQQMRELADLYRFKILEDASHATGASYLGFPVGSKFADATVFSFHAVKIITTGEGGMVTTQEKEIADKLRSLRSHGTTRDPREFRGKPGGGWYYEQQSLGFNYRLTDIQASLGLSQLGRLETMQTQRADLAVRYDRILSELPLFRPPHPLDRRSSWHLYSIEIDNARSSRTRDEVYSKLREAGIGVNAHYIPIHTQPFYRDRGFNPGDFPASELYFSRAISIPLFPALTHAQQDIVASHLAKALNS